MYQLNDTIVAVSSPTFDNGVIIRVTGPDALRKSSLFFRPVANIEESGLYSGTIDFGEGLAVSAQLYLFVAPHSYTAEDIVELHFHSNVPLTEFVIEKFISTGLRLAEPGEFTARAYLNSKISLEQAEAVNEIITGSNRFQLAAAQNLLGGKLGKRTKEIKDQITEIIALIEAGFDFSGEDIEFISVDKAENKIKEIIGEIQNILDTSVTAETIIDLPAIGIAGVPNAGKSSLLNCLINKNRSIVSEESKTTRDILSAKLSLCHSQSVIFDCAGLITDVKTILDQLAQQAAIDALRSAIVTIFCVDLTKADWGEDIGIRKMITNRSVISLATKSDILDEKSITEKLEKLNTLFETDFLPISTHTNRNICTLKNTLDQAVLNACATDAVGRHLTLTVRHKQALTDAVDSLNQATIQIGTGCEEIAAMMLRAAYLSLGNIETEDIDKEVLGQIFSRFCIGK